MSLDLEEPIGVAHGEGNPCLIAEVQPIRDARGLEALADAWNELAGDVPFRRYEWLGAWWRHFGANRDLHVLACYDGAGGLAGLAPFCGQPGQPQRWMSLGSGLVCSDHQTLLALPENAGVVGAAVAGWLTSEGQGLWTSLAMDGIAAEDPAIGALSDQAQRLGVGSASRQHTCCWQTHLPDTWDAFVMRFTKRRRTTVRQLYRKIFEEGQIEVRLVESRSDLDEAWPILVELHQKRQRSLRHAGCFSTPEFGGFLREAAERFLDLGQLRLQWLSLNGRPAAAQFDLVGGGTQYHYLSGMEPELLAERPGRMGMLAVLHRAQAEGIRTYDFLRGDHRYKSDWLAEPTPIFEWCWGAANWRGRLDLARTTTNWRLRALAKRWLSRFRSH